MHTRRLAAGALVAIAACAAALAATPTPTASAATITFRPVADTYVASDLPATNFGTGGQLWIDASPTRRTFLRFNVSGLTEPVVQARLRMHVDNSSSAASNRGGTYRLMSNTSWSETGPTWNSQPAINGTTLGTIGAVARNTWVELNVTGKITGNGVYSIGVTSAGSDGAGFDSRETGTLAPQLVIVTGTTVPGDPVLVGAGDIASLNSNGDTNTAALLDNIPGTVYTAGDNAYPNGTLEQFNAYYEPTWGRHKARTRPSPGNHEYNTAGAVGYYSYFGALAGPSNRGYYSYELGNWHVVSLNSEVNMTVGSPQETWLRGDLAASTKPCTFAYWHKPLFTSGTNHAGETLTRPLFQALYDHDAEVVVTGHNHHYERFAPMNPAGALDTANGIRHFVAGTGGVGHYTFGTPQPNSQVRNGTAFGVLKFTLHSNSYDWQFVPVAGQTFTDTGTTVCH
jgi:acid phosphatase type 7